ncbi:MAG TPA: hypothetical protein VN688_31480 [Gemmataceae bacterium]|nr:hypothetical protein [Gemmataceae bacterium]
MSNLWRKTPGAGWEAVPLPGRVPGETFDLGISGLGFVALNHGLGGGMGLLVRTGLLVRVNGQPVIGGFRVLDHRDEILLGRRRFFFSAESTPIRVAFRLEDEGRSPACPVCRGLLRDGEQAVRCPGCNRWYHQIEAGEGQRGKPCWTYAQNCRFCHHPTALTENAGWRPEKEEAHD